MANLNQTAETPKLKINTEIKTTIKKEVNLPYLCKYGNHHFIKVITPSQAITVQNYSFCIKVEVSDTSRVEGLLADSNSTPCTEEEFNEVLELVKAKINAL